MDRWAKAVADANIRCPWCRYIARWIFRGGPLTGQERRHIEQHVTTLLGTAPGQVATEGAMHRRAGLSSQRGRSTR